MLPFNVDNNVLTGAMIGLWKDHFLCANLGGWNGRSLASGSFEAMYYSWVFAFPRLNKF